MQPPEFLGDSRTASQIDEDKKTADEFAKPGTVMHFAMRLGFMPYDEAGAEAILERIMRENEWYSLMAEQRWI